MSTRAGIVLLSLFAAFGAVAQPTPKLKITILSTMLTDLKGIGEWGFSALVESDSTRILFDAGLKANTVKENSKELNISLANIPRLILSHNHLDHTGGFKTLTQQYKDSGSFSITYTGPGFFYRDSIPVGLRKNTDSAAYAAAGGRFIPVGKFMEIAPSIYLTGPVPRQYPEKNYPPGKKIRTPAGIVEDNVPEDISMVIKTSEGLILLSGCGHAGVVNTIEYVQQQFPGQKITAIIGGFHLLDTGETAVDWTAKKLKDAGVNYIVGAHCTGLNALYQLRQATGLQNNQCVVGAVGMTYTLGKGITTGWMK